MLLFFQNLPNYVNIHDFFVVEILGEGAFRKPTGGRGKVFSNKIIIRIFKKLIIQSNTRYRSDKYTKNLQNIPLRVGSPSGWVQLTPQSTAGLCHFQHLHLRCISHILWPLSYDISTILTIYDGGGGGFQLTLYCWLMPPSNNFLCELQKSKAIWNSCNII